MDIIAVIISSLTLLWTFISFFLLHKQSKEIQQLQAKYDRTNYMSQVQFDIEIETYKKLSVTFHKLYFSIHSLFPNGLDRATPFDEEKKIEYRKKIYEDAVKAYNGYIEVLFANRPFIDENIYKGFDELRDKARLQIAWFPDLMIFKRDTYIKEYAEEETQCWKRTSEIEKEKDELLKLVREHLKSIMK
jgi:hypothetical protein